MARTHDFSVISAYFVYVVRYAAEIFISWQ